MFAVSDASINVAPCCPSFSACCLCRYFSFSWMDFGCKVFGAEVSNITYQTCLSWIGGN